MQTEPDIDQAADQGQPERLVWTSHPIRDDLPRSLLLPLFIAAFSLAALRLLEGWGYGVVSAVVLLGATLRYFVPTTYELDRRGVWRRGRSGRTLLRPWSEVRGVYRHPDGIFLTPFARPSRLDSFRGVYLRYAGNRAEVEAFVRRRVGAGG